MSSLASKIRCEKRRIEKFSAPTVLLCITNAKNLLAKSIKKLENLEKKKSEEPKL